MTYQQIKNSNFIEQASAIVLENIHNHQFDVTQLSDELNMSRATLHRKLKACDELSATAFIRKLKLERSMTLLEKSPMNITEIALECGFNNLTYFDKCFREHYGYAPNDVRKNRTNGFPYQKKVPNNGQAIPQKDNAPQFNQLHNFPAYATSFIGRIKEIHQIQQLLTSHRIVSLIGQGGCGKTRLVCESCGSMPRFFKDGIWFVDLSSIASGTYVVNKLLQTLRIPEVPGKVLFDLLINKIQDKDLLLVLDNCEHLAEACANVIHNLIQKVKGIKILVTSRVVLNVAGEQVWRIPNLSTADPANAITCQQAKESEAVSLFTNRAQLSDSRFELLDINCEEISTICKQLDGIPLALELVASRIRYMDPATLLNRLSHNFSSIPSPGPVISQRHKTLNATFNWSYNLLSDEEKILFKRLSIFSGGFDLAAAEEVCKDHTLPPAYILDLLSNLVDHSMITTIRKSGQAMRYSMLETVKQYATALLQYKEQMALNKKHLDYFITLAEKGYSERMKSQDFWLKKLSLEFDNLIAALSWAKHNNQSKYRLLAGLLAWSWSKSGHYSLAKNMLGDIIDTHKARSATKARILSGYAWACVGNFEDFDTLIRYFMQATSIWKKLKNIKEEAIATAEVAAAISFHGDYEKGLKYATKAGELAQKTNSPDVILYCLWPLVLVLVALKKCDEARGAIKQLLELSEQLNHLHLKAVGYITTGDCAAIERSFSDAGKAYAKGLEISLQAGDTFYIANELLGIAIACSGLGEYEKALRLTGASNALAKKAGSMSREQDPWIFWQELVKEHIMGARKKLGEELTQKYETEGASMELDDVTAYALNFESN